MVEDDVKKKIWILCGLVIVILITLGVYDVRHPNSQTADTSHTCAINYLETFDFNVATSTPQSSIARALLTQLLNQYKSLTNCPTLGISDYSITSIGAPTQVKNDFTVPATFDVVPISKTQTLWALASTTWDGSWIRGERVTLGVTNVSTTTTSQSYRLVLQ